MKKLLILGILVLIIAACLSSVFYEANGAYYYTQVDAGKCTPGQPRQGVIDASGGMAFSYTLPSYDEAGNEKELSFGASKELRGGAFLRLTVAPLRGVIHWEELKYDELPAAVQEKYR